MNTNSFALRHIGPREKEVEEMLEAIGAESIEQLVEQTVPKDIRLDTPLNLAPAMSEHEFLNHIHALGAKNKNYKTYTGLVYGLYTIPG
jgi:glycine dehydrogenase